MRDAGELSERLYGVHASDFDAQRGLAAGAPEWIAHALLQLMGPTQPSETRRSLGSVLDLGAGTGEIGVGLAAHCESYAGLESSDGMAARWRERFTMRPDLLAKSQLFTSDVNRAWPSADGSVDVIFASRSAHWFDVPHVRDELARVARVGACFVLGRVVRSADHPRRWLRHEVHRALRKRGLEPKDGPRSGSELLFEIVRRSPRARWISRQAVLEWSFRAAPGPILEAWRRKPSLAGLELAEEVRLQVLDDVAELANQRFGALQTELACHEQYAIEGVQLAPDRAAGEPRLSAAFPIRLASRLGPPLAEVDPPTGTS